MNCNKMADLADKDMVKIEKLSRADLDFLIEKFEYFTRQFGKRLEGMELSETVRKFMYNSGGEIPKEAIELFSMQCKALIGKLLLDEKGLKL